MEEKYNRKTETKAYRFNKKKTGYSLEALQ